MKRIQFFTTVLLSLMLFYTTCEGLPILDSGSVENDDNDDNSDVYIESVKNLPRGFNFSGFNLTGLRNDTPKNLYTVKVIVYEIGILTEADENDTSDEETRERVDLTFFDARSNDSHIDLGNIPLPIQTNVSGQILTGIAPINIGAFSNPSELLETLPLTGTIVNISHSDTAYFKLTTSELDSNEEEHIFKPDDLSRIPQFKKILPSDVLQPLNDINASAEDLEFLSNYKNNNSL